MLQRKRPSQQRYWALVLVTVILAVMGVGALNYARAEDLAPPPPAGETIPPLQPFVKTAFNPKALPNGIVTYQIVLDNSLWTTYTGSLIGITDTLPAGLAVMAPITASKGDVTLVHADLITWTGALAYRDRITITYQALVLPNVDTATLTNTAVLWERRGPTGWITPTNRTLTAAAAIRVQPFWPEAYLPQLLVGPTPTPAPTPLPPINLLQPKNGPFEDGSNGDWTEQSNDKDTKIIYRNGEKITLLLPPFQGQPNQYFAWMGGEFSARNVLQQNTLLPAKLSSLSLTFDAWIESADDCGNDTAKVYVGNQEIGAYDLCKANNSPVNPNTGGWTRKTLPITNYAALAGQDTTIKFQVSTNATKNSNWYLDNVRLCSSDTRVAAQDRCQ